MVGNLVHTVAILVACGWLVFIERRTVGATYLLLAGFVVLYGAGFAYFSYMTPFLVSHVVERVQFALGLGVLALAVGAVLAHLCFGSTQRERALIVKSWSSSAARWNVQHDVLLALLALAAAAYLFYGLLALGKLGEIASFLASQSTVERAEIRSESGSGYLYSILFTSLAPFLCGILLVRCLTGAGTALRICAATLIIAVFLARVGTLHKTQWVVFLGQMALTVYVVSSLQPRLRTVLAAAIGLTATLFAASWLAFPEAPWWSILQYLVYRGAQITNEVLYQTLYVYPDMLPHAGGMNVGLLARIAGEVDYVPAHSAVAAFMGAPNSTFNALFVAGAWVDFGWAGVAAVATMVGFIVKSYDLFALSMGKTPVSCALLGFAVIPVDQLLATSAQTAMLTGGLLSVPLITAALQFAPMLWATRRTLPAED